MLLKRYFKNYQSNYVNTKKMLMNKKLVPHYFRNVRKVYFFIYSIFAKGVLNECCNNSVLSTIRIKITISKKCKQNAKRVGFTLFNRTICHFFLPLIKAKISIPTNVIMKIKDHAYALCCLSFTWTFWLFQMFSMKFISKPLKNGIF